MVCLQAGFLPTAAVSLVYAAQVAHVLLRHITPIAVCTRALALAGVPCLLAFFIDLHHRTRFLRTNAAGATGATALAKDNRGPLPGL